MLQKKSTKTDNMKLTTLLVFFSAIPKPLAGSPILRARRNPNEIHVSRQEHRKVCEISVHERIINGVLVEARLCRNTASAILGPGRRDVNHFCKQQFILHDNNLVPSGCALVLVKERNNKVEENKHAEETPGTRECVLGDRYGSLGTLDVFFVQETIEIRHLHLQTEVTVNAGCSTYYKEH